MTEIVKISSPLRHIYPVLGAPGREVPWKVQHGVDLLEVLDPVLGVFSVGRKVGVDEEEGGAEEEEGSGHGTLGLELGTGTGVEAVGLGNGAVPDEVAPEEDGLERSCQ